MNRAAPWREDIVQNGSPDPYPAVVWLGGRNLFVTDCDLWSSYNVLSTLQNGNRIQFATIARNRIWNGGAAHFTPSLQQAVFEDNTMTGISTTAMGSNLPQVRAAAPFPAFYSFRKVSKKRCYSTMASRTSPAFRTSTSRTTRCSTSVREPELDLVCELRSC